VVDYSFPRDFLDMIFVKVTVYEYENGIPLQWTMAFLIPLSRGIWEHVLPKLFNKAAGDKNEAAIFSMKTAIGVRFALYVAVRLSVAEESTTNWILAVEFCINLLHALQIIWLQNKVQGDLTEEEILKWKNKKKDMIRSFVTTESIEILVALAYSMCFATAYYGPNATILAGVRNNYWQNSEVTDIENYFLILFKLAAIDAVGAIVIGFLLAFVCKINIFGEYCNVMKKHWITISLYMGKDILTVRNII
jgi:hypothetical protein